MISSVTYSILQAILLGIVLTLIFYLSISQIFNYSTNQQKALTSVNFKFYSIVIIGTIGFCQIAIHFSMTFVIVTTFIPAFYITWKLRNIILIALQLFYTAVLLCHFPRVSKFMNGDSVFHLLTELTKDHVCGGNTHMMFFFICFIPGVLMLVTCIYLDLKRK